MKKGELRSPFAERPGFSIIYYGEGISELCPFSATISSMTYIAKHFN